MGFDEGLPDKDQPLSVDTLTPQLTNASFVTQRLHVFGKSKVFVLGKGFHAVNKCIVACE